MEASETSRSALAERLLDEVVFASRARQTALNSIAGGDASCGLGARAEFERRFGTRASALCAELWPECAATEGADPASNPERDAALAAWVRRQDGLDRERNHFLKAFRGEHGFDRANYSLTVLAGYEEGLAAVNQKHTTERRRAAEGLLSAGSPPR